MLIAEIEYRAWTHDGKLRHASYKGLRDAADQKKIHEIDWEHYGQPAPGVILTRRNTIYLSHGHVRRRERDVKFT